MEASIASDASQHLAAATTTAIADLSPTLSETQSRAVRGVVTITWPYNSVKGTFAFILAEPDYCLRRSKGQARINLTGPSAKHAGESGLGSGDTILLGLDGVEWEPQGTKRRQSLPGANIDWQLKFTEKLLLQVTSAETQEARLISVDHPPPAEPQRAVPVEAPPSETIQIDDFLPEGLGSFATPGKTHVARFKDGEYESPAFIKRARTSYGSLFEEGYDIFEDDGGIVGKGRKRTRFGRGSGAWRYSSLSSSPEPTVPQERPSSPPRPDTADEGCQTMELDLPVSSPKLPAEEPIEIQQSPKPSLMEEQPFHQQDMVDHGVQGEFHSEWPTTTPASLSSFDPKGAFSANTPAIPAFQPGIDFGTPGGPFQPMWDPRAVNPPPDGYSQIIEPPPVIQGFSNTYGDERSVEARVMRSGSGTRSPSKPNHLAVDDIVQPPDNHLLTDEYPLPAPPQSTIYPPLDVDNEGRISPIPRDSRLDYSASYLDNARPLSQEAIDVKRGPFGASVPVAADAGPTSWATANHPSQAAAVPQMGRPSSASGDSIENAVVIDESDLDDGPPPPTAAEDAVMNGRADALDMYDEAEVEDEVDAQFSDDDEPEYDANEMGGDYDTRNYIGPDDDEDDSHDEDLRSHDLEPEFEEGESYDEDDEDVENPDYESDYHVEYEEPEQPPRPKVQSAPQVIDLISSSEDEEEDDAAKPPPPPSRTVPQNIPQGLSAVSPRDISSQALRQADHSDSEDQSSDGDEDEGLDEDEVEEEIEMQDQVVPPDHLPSYVMEDEDVGEPLEDEEEDITGDQEVTAVSDLGPQAREFENQQSDKTITDRKESPQVSTMENLNTQDENSDAIMEDQEDAIPQSAADGLEILSRVIEDQSSANREAVLPEKTQNNIVITTSVESDVLLAEPAQEWETQLEEPRSQEDDTVDLIPTGIPLPDAPSDGQRIAVEENKTAAVLAPSSPPLTQSFKTQAGDEESMDIVMQETTTNTITEPQILSDQLPTPQDTQLTGDTTNSNRMASTSFEIDEPVSIATDYGITAGQLMGTVEPLLAAESTTTQVEEQPVEPAVVSRQQTPSNNVGDIPQPQYAAVSPSLSFQSQVNVDDTAQGFMESGPKIPTEAESGAEAKNEAEILADVETDASAAGASFISQMEVDDELQASIMEYSQSFDGDTNFAVSEGDESHRHIRGDQSEADVTEVEDEVHPEPEVVPRGPSPELGNEDEDQSDKQPDVSEVDLIDTLEHTSETDPSVQLARAANASKRNTKQQEITTKRTPAQRKSLPAREIPTPEVEDSSVQLARASLKSQVDEESNSMTAAKLMLVRHLRDELPDYTSLKVLRQYLQRKLDIIAVAMMQPPEPQRAKGGPREYMMSFTITDHSIGPYSVVEVQLYRPHKETLPIVKAGDVVLLRNFTAISLHNKGFGLRTNDESSWAVFDHEGEPAQIKGPPVEYGEKETAYVAHMRVWLGLLDDKAQEKLERANKRIVEAGSRSK
ncbi:hypothetical protein GGR52DRAFT_556311 [Hypoxylon sp. FL1284]|nr:hypothetical protein GGR52DRAFT_556311 [Hypoxylon sp. FL1284]